MKFLKSISFAIILAIFAGYAYAQTPPNVKDSKVVSIPEVVALTSPWTLKKGSTIVKPQVAYTSSLECITAANLLGPTVAKSTNFSCSSKTTTKTVDRLTTTTSSVDTTIKVVVLPTPVMTAGIYVNLAKLANVKRGVGINYDNFGQNPPGVPVVDFPSLSGDGTGDFRTVCFFSHFAFDDPIVYPGQPGKSHLHTFFGNTGANAYSTADSIANSGNSTCRGGTINRTGYWTPAMLDTGDGSPIVPDAMISYYKTGYSQVFPADMHDLPPGLRMVAGDAKGTTSQNWGPTEFVCEAPDRQIKNPSGLSGIISDCPVGAVLWMKINFPQCWDGKNLDSPDHRSHMAYGNTDGAAAQNGGPKLGCPTTHPVGLPAITINVLYTVKDAAAYKRWRLASDVYDKTLPGGYSAHADWFDGWKPDIVHTWTELCLKAAKDCQAHKLGDGRIMAEGVQ